MFLLCLIVSIIYVWVLDLVRAVLSCFFFFFLLQIIFLLSNGEKITNVEAILLLFKTINSQKPLCTIQKGKKC